MSAPERIWALPSYDWEHGHFHRVEPPVLGARVEYIRADAILSDPRVKALVGIMSNPIRSDDGFYDYNQDDVDTALAAFKGGQDAEDQ